MKLMYVEHVDGTQETYAYDHYRVENGCILIIRTNKETQYQSVAVIVSGFKKAFPSDTNN